MDLFHIIRKHKGPDKSNKQIESKENSGSISVVISDSSRDANQDACGSIYIPESNTTIIAVADGISNTFMPGEGSRFVIDEVLKLCAERIRNNEAIDFTELFHNIHERLKIWADDKYAGQALEPDSFGTTLIVGVDTESEFIVAYVGNGCVYHISAHFTKFPKTICIPWNAVNILNPHTIPENGREALYRYLCYSGELTRFTPTVIRVQKSIYPGDLFVIGTDGLDSSDHGIPGVNDANDIFVPVSKNKYYLLKFLSHYVTSSIVTEDGLRNLLKDYLNSIRCRGYMRDDTTIGVVIPKVAIDYFKSKLSPENNVTETNSN